MGEFEKEIGKSVGKMAIDVVEDIVRPTSKSIGKNIGQFVDGCMGWLAYWGQKQQIRQKALLTQFKENIENEIEKIPKENLVEPSLRIVGPAVEASKFFIEETTCRKMFAQLIASACDNRKSNIVHPSFPEIIKQLSSIDARFILLFKKQATFPIAELTEKDSKGLLTPYPNLLFDFMNFSKEFTIQEQVELSKSVDNLIRFGLLAKNDRIIQLNYNYEAFKKHPFYVAVQNSLKDGSVLYMHRYRLELTLLGKNFVNSCVPDELMN